MTSWSQSRYQRHLAVISYQTDTLFAFCVCRSLQTPGGMNEFVISELAKAGKYDSMAPVMDALLKKFKGE